MINDSVSAVLNVMITTALLEGHDDDTVTTKSTHIKYCKIPKISPSIYKPLQI